nr:immunoglobulin light chain junction region [Macaca mulatta]
CQQHSSWPHLTF